jgi:hypothetical protein
MLMTLADKIAFLDDGGKNVVSVDCNYHRGFTDWTVQTEFNHGLIQLCETVSAEDAEKCVRENRVYRVAVFNDKGRGVHVFASTLELAIDTALERYVVHKGVQS